MLSHILKKKKKQDGPGSCCKILCDKVFPTEWLTKKEYTIPFCTQQKYTVHLPIFEFGKIYLRLSSEDSQAEISLKTLNFTTIIASSGLLSVSSHSSSDLSNNQNVFLVSFLLFAIRDGKRKSWILTWAQWKLKVELKDGVSSLLYLLERWCNRLGNTVRTLKDDALMTVISLLYHPPRDFILLPFSYFSLA